MFCAKCGKEIDNDSTFCPYCGQKVGEPVVHTNACSTISSFGEKAVQKASVLQGVKVDRKVYGTVLVIAAVIVVVFGVSKLFGGKETVPEKPYEMSREEASEDIGSEDTDVAEEKPVYTVTKADLENIADAYFRARWEYWDITGVRYEKPTNVSPDDAFSGLAEVIRLYSNYSSADQLTYAGFRSGGSNIDTLEYYADTDEKVFLTGYPVHRRNGLEMVTQGLRLNFKPMKDHPDRWEIVSIKLEDDSYVIDGEQPRITEIDYKSLYNAYIEDNLKVRPEGYDEYFFHCYPVLLDANQDGVPECVVERSFTVNDDGGDVKYIEHYMLCIDDSGTVLAKKVDSDRIIDKIYITGSYNNGCLYFLAQDTQYYKLSNEYSDDELDVVPEGFKLYNDGEVGPNSMVCASRNVYQKYVLDKSGWRLDEEHICGSDEYDDVENGLRYIYEALDDEITFKDDGYAEYGEEGLNRDAAYDFFAQFSRGKDIDAECFYDGSANSTRGKYQLGYQADLDAADIEWQKY